MKEKRVKKKVRRRAPEDFSNPDDPHMKQKNILGPAIFNTLSSVDFARLIFTGRSTMGKTTLAVDIIMEIIIKKVNRCFAVCPTFWQQPQLKRLRAIDGAFTERTVFTRVDDSVFEYIFRELERERAPTLLFIDDAAAEAATNKGNKGAFSRLCLAAPHLGPLWIVCCTQRLTASSPALRDNAEGLISFVPTKIQDVDTIQKEYNPAPAHKKSLDVVKDALTKAWDTSRYCFIWRENWTGGIKYFSGFDHSVKFNK